MGVIGSHCQLCRLPLHHDHYVQQIGGGGLKIYRTNRPHGGHDFAPGEKVVQFGLDHAWLCQAVAIRRSGDGVLQGAVEDGVLIDGRSGETAFIWDGDDEAIAYHHWCWEQMGSPETEQAAVRGRGLYAWAVVETYKGQLFEHHEFREHGFGWMLADPSRPAGARSRTRIETMLARAQTRPREQYKYKTVRELVRAEYGWAGTVVRDGDYTPKHIIHFRKNLHRDLDGASYPTLVWAMKEYGAPELPPADTMQALGDYEAALIDAVEFDDRAIVLMTTLGDGQTQYLVQARDEAATRAVIDALPAPAGTKNVEYDNEDDPTWSNFFDKMDPSLHGRE